MELTADEQTWFPHLSKNSPAHLQKEAIAFFRQYENIPQIIIFCATAPTMKSTWENALRVLEKWIIREQRITDLFLGIASWVGPGSAYANEALHLHAAELRPYLVACLEDAVTPETKEVIEDLLDSLRT